MEKTNNKRPANACTTVIQMGKVVRYEPHEWEMTPAPSGTRYVCRTCMQWRCAEPGCEQSVSYGRRPTTPGTYEALTEGKTTLKVNDYCTEHRAQHGQY